MQQRPQEAKSLLDRYPRPIKSLTGTTQCASCHQFGASTPTFKCLDCHREIAGSLQCQARLPRASGHAESEQQRLCSLPSGTQRRGFQPNLLGAFRKSKGCERNHSRPRLRSTRGVPTEMSAMPCGHGTIRPRQRTQQSTDCSGGGQPPCRLTSCIGCGGQKQRPESWPPACHSLNGCGGQI